MIIGVVLMSSIMMYIMLHIVNYISLKDNVDIQISIKDLVIIGILIGLIEYIIVINNNIYNIAIYSITVFYLILTSIIDIKTKYIYNIVNRVYFILSIIWLIIAYKFGGIKLSYRECIISTIILVLFIGLNKAITAIETGDIDMLISLYIVLICKNIGYIGYSELSIGNQIAFNPVFLVIMLSIIIGALSTILNLIFNGFKKREATAFSPYIAFSTIMVLILL